MIEFVGKIKKRDSYFAIPPIYRFPLNKRNCIQLSVIAVELLIIIFLLYDMRGR